MIFSAYLIIEVCLLGSLIAQFSTGDSNKPDEETQLALTTLYYMCKFSTYFGFIFLMLITAELFPTSLRCTGMGLCFSMKMLGSLISSKEMVFKKKIIVEPN